MLRELTARVRQEPGNIAFVPYSLESNPRHIFVYEVYRDEAALWSRDNEPGGFEWIEGGDAANSALSFVRWDNHGNAIVALFNFSGTPIGPYRVGLPFAGTWEEVLNTDAAEYGGSGVGNFGSVVATDTPHGGRPASAELTLPPLGALWLRLRN